MTTVEILEKAKKLVEKGWQQGADGYMDPDTTTCCAQKAIWLAIGTDARDTMGDGHSAFVRVLRFMETQVTGARLPRWNDAPGRTQAEVVAAFTKAIELAKAQP